MSDIARHAGVSPMTVSRALSDPPSVSDKMRRKVDAAVRQFGYRPNRIAGSLSSKRSNVGRSGRPVDPQLALRRHDPRHLRRGARQRPASR